MAAGLPTEIVEREKVGFPTPLARMFRNDLSAYLRDLLLANAPPSAGTFDPKAVERLITEQSAAP